MKRALLIDADSLVYLAAKANEVEVQWDEDLWTLHSHLEPAIAQLDAAVSKLQEKLEADRVVMALSDYTNPWRKNVMPTYKSNRADTRKPIIFRPLREYVHEKYETFQRPGLEGDDILGILLTAPGALEGVDERVCVSVDKDMATLPGKHFKLSANGNVGDGETVIREVSLEAADRFHMFQTLTGDSVDGYKGCPKVGPVSAEKVLGDAKTVAEMWPRVVAAYVKAGLSEEVALMNARVARICRADDYDFKEKKVKLWNPIQEFVNTAEA